MCTVIPFEELNKPLIAEKDMIVYKTGYKLLAEDSPDMYSVFMNFRYVPGKLYKVTEMTYDYVESWSDFTEGDYRKTLKNPRFVKDGFHSYALLDRGRIIPKWGTENTIFIAEFTIPKGSKYHHNGSDNIVSNQIIFNKFIE